MKRRPHSGHVRSLVTAALTLGSVAVLAGFATSLHTEKAAAPSNPTADASEPIVVSSLEALPSDEASQRRLSTQLEPALQDGDSSFLVPAQVSAVWRAAVDKFPFPAAPGYDLPPNPLPPFQEDSNDIYEDGLAEINLAFYWRCSWARVGVDAIASGHNDSPILAEAESMLSGENFKIAIGPSNVDYVAVDEMISMAKETATITGKQLVEVEYEQHSCVDILDH